MIRLPFIPSHQLAPSFTRRFSIRQPGCIPFLSSLKSPQNQPLLPSTSGWGWGSLLALAPILLLSSITSSALAANGNPFSIDQALNLSRDQQQTVATSQTVPVPSSVSAWSMLNGLPLAAS